MLPSLIRKEIVLGVLSLRFAVTFVLFFVLTLVSVFTMTRGYERALRLHEVGAARHHEQVRGIQEAEEPDEALHDILFGGDGFYGDRAPRPMGVFVKGLEDRLPTQVNVSLWHVRPVDDDRYRNPLFRLFASPDYAYIANIVISLLALLFVFDAVCGEKERGTLKILLANRVPRDLVLLGKWIGGYLSLAVPLAAALFASLTYVVLTGAVRVDADFLSRFLWIAGVSLLYVSVFFGLGMLISTLTHKASTALLVSLFVWICWILVIPNLAPVAARLAVPVPTRQKIEAEKEAVDRETQIGVQRVNRNMLGYGRKAEEMVEEIEKQGDARKDRIDQYYHGRLRRQVDLSRNLSRASPSASFVLAASDLAGTGVDLFTAFNTAVRRYGEEFSEHWWEWDEEYHENDEEMPDDAWLEVDEWPALRMEQARLDDVVDAVLLDVLLLVVFNVLFFLLSYLFFLRYDVT